MNAHATQELVGREALMRSLSSLAPALGPLDLIKRLSDGAGHFGEFCFDGSPLVRLEVSMKPAFWARGEGLRVKPARGLEKLVAAILANDRESRFPVVWHDGWPFVACCGTATIAGGAGASNSRPDGEGGVA